MSPDQILHLNPVAAGLKERPNESFNPVSICTALKSSFLIPVRIPGTRMLQSYLEVCIVNNPIFSNRILSRIFLILMVFIILGGSVLAKETDPIPQPLTGTQTAEIISKLYKHLGPELGQSFVESNVVLTIAGARGYTEMYVDYPEAGDSEKFIELNEVLKGTPISVSPIIMKGLENSLTVSFENLKGYEVISRSTKLEGIVPFYADEGREGLKKWWNTCFENLEKNGNFSSKEDRRMLMEGIRYGYPDRAIMDFIDWINTGRKKYHSFSNIPYSSLYSCAEPNFCYYPESEDDEGIRSTVALWGEILREFYRTPFCRELETNPEFIKARLEAKKKHDRYMKEKWKKIAED